MPDIEYHQTIQYFSPKLVRGVRVGRPDFESVKFSPQIKFISTPDIQVTTLSRTIQIQQA